ncbi:PREDICTED: latexin isoform X1 [Calidris pugnax]|uniref:latexin isoform X1 n=1 Tax=Calidris pugnax TaxID=198806 RepID=UPI00071CFA76|nr:PREDICTED: latexin isoform X1 [Calidris pugnax]
MELQPSHSLASRAATLATGYLCYRRGSPGRGLVLRSLRQAGRKDIDDVGHKYYLELVLEDVLDKDSTVNCTAEVLYHLGNKSIAPDVQFTLEGELKNTDEADNVFYNRIRSLEKELVAENIPDSHGNVPPELEPIRRLAWAASGYVIWQNSTENTKFHLAQIKHVKQVVSYHQCPARKRAFKSSCGTYKSTAETKFFSKKPQLCPIFLVWFILKSVWVLFHLLLSFSKSYKFECLLRSLLLFINFAYRSCVFLVRAVFYVYLVKKIDSSTWRSPC